MPGRDAMQKRHCEATCGSLDGKNRMQIQLRSTVTWRGGSLSTYAPETKPELRFTRSSKPGAVGPRCHVIVRRAAVVNVFCFFETGNAALTGKNEFGDDRGMRALVPFLFSVLVVAGTPMVLGADSAKKPDIIFILVDDLRWDELGYAGHSFAKTPNIDRIAHQGIRFRNAFTSAPLCSPARACLLTGQHVSHHGILDNTNRSEHSHKLRTFPMALQKSGYRTAYIGKWHMGNDDSARPGYDRWVSMKGQGTSFDPLLNVDGEQVEHVGHTTDVLNRYAAEFVGAARENDQPICLYLAHKALHPELVQRDDGSITDPDAKDFMPAKRHEKLYENSAVPRRLNVLDDLEGKPALQRKIDGLPPLSRATGTSDKVVRDRQRMLVAVDEGVGQLFEALEKVGRLENAIIVLTSDHGYWYGEHGLSVERRLAYEEAIRIPLLMRYPQRIEAGQTHDAMALTIDFAPTLLEMADADPLPGVKMDGRSLVPLLDGKTPADWRQAFRIEYNTDTVFPRVLTMGYRAIRTERWKYIRYLDLEGMDELYDLREDPYEMRNVVGENAELVEKLGRKLDVLGEGR